MDSLPPEDTQFFDSLDGMPSTERFSISPLRKPAAVTDGLMALDTEQQLDDIGMDDDFPIRKPVLSFLKREANKSTATSFKFGPQVLTTPGQFSRNSLKASPLLQGGQNNLLQGEVQTNSKLACPPILGRRAAGNILRGKGAVSELSNLKTSRQTPMTPTTCQPLNKIGSINSRDARSIEEKAVPEAVQALPFLSPKPQIQFKPKSSVKRQPTVQDLPFDMEETQAKSTTAAAAARIVSPINLTTLVRSAKSQESYQQRQYQPRDQRENHYQLQQEENDPDQYQDYHEDNHQDQREDHRQDRDQGYNQNHRQGSHQDNHQGRHQTRQQHQQQDQDCRDNGEERQPLHPSPAPRAPPSNRVTKERTGHKPYVSTKKLIEGSKTSPPAKPVHPPHQSREQAISWSLIPSPLPRDSRLASTRCSSHSAAKDLDIPGHRDKDSHQPNCDTSQRSIWSSDIVPSSSGHQQQNIKAATSFTNSMAGIINRYNQSQRSALDKQRAQYKEQIKTLEREIAKSAEDTKHHRARSEAKSKELEELQATSDEKANRIRELECKLEASEIQPRQLSEKFRELEKKLEDSQCKNVLLSDKLHELKTNYNQAITEQQDLYTRSMTHCEDTIKELQEIASAKKAVAERAVQNAEAIREEMLQRVRQDIAEHKAEASDLGRQIETLTQQVQEKDTKLSQQNETIRDLSAKVHDLETSSNGYETLAAQNQEILQRIRDQGFQTHNQSEECAKETWNRLESVSNNLDALAKSFSTQPEMISGIQEAQAKELGSIATKLDFVLETRVSVKETTSQFSTELEAQMGKIWGRLDSQIETLTQQLAQKAEENGILSALCKETQAAYERLEQDIEGLQKASAEQIEEINALQEREQENQLAMEAAREDDQQQTQELVQRLKASEAEAGRLREELKSKIDTMAKLKEQLRAMEEEYGNGLRSFSAEILKLNQALENKDRAAQDAVNRAVEMTAREDKVKMEEALAETQKLLRQRDEHTIALQTQLEELRKSLHDKEQNQRRDACTLSSLREVLSTAESKEKELVEKLTTQSVKADEREAQLRRQMNVVNAELEATKTKVGEYEGEIEGAKRRAEKFEGDSHNQRARVQALFSAVKDWAREGGLETSSLDQICDENKSAQEVGTGISQALAKLGLSQRLQTSHHQRDDLLLDGSESQFNTANREHLVLLSQDSHAFNGPEQSHDVLALINSRRVVVRSPANDPATPIPPSVSEEKARRREGLKPKSIMKTNTVARVTRSVSLMAQGADAESADGDGAQHDSRNEHLMASSPDPLVTNATETPTLPASNPHPPMVGRAQQAGQNKRKQPDEPGPDFFVSRSRKPRTSQMSEDIKTETLAQLEELVGPKRRSAKKRSVRTYGSQRPAESPPEDGSPFNALSTLHSESHAQSRYLTQQHQSPGSNKPRESQESSKTSEDSSETVGAHNEIVLEGGGSSTRLPPLRRNVRRRS